MPVPPSLPERPELPAGVDRPPVPPRLAPPLRPQRGAGADLAGMPIWAPILVFVAGVIASLLVATVVVVAYEASGTAVDADAPPDAVTIIGTIAQNAAWVLLAFFAVQRLAGAPVAERLGLRRVGTGSAIGWSVLVYVVFWIAAGLVAVTLGEPEAEQTLVEELRAEDDAVVLVSYGIVATVFAPLGEEILFRGLLFGALRERMPYWAAALLAGGVFGAIHLDAPLQGILVLGVLGTGLCLLYHVTGSLLPAIGLHALHNAITFSYTKGLPWWGSAAVVAASVAAVTASGVWLARGRRPAPA